MDETNWAFTDAEGATVTSGGPYGNGGIITSNDMITLLSVFGTECP